MSYKEKSYSVESIITGSVGSHYNFIIYILKLFQLFGIKHKIYKSKTTNSLYVFVYQNGNKEGIKFRISDH